jgi:DNA-directed RNA polymerase specialized sigma24 family protein
VARLREDLEHEWQDLAGRPQAIAAVRRWAESEPILDGFPSPVALVAAAHRRSSARAANDLLGALVRLSGEDRLARRCLLQALLPALASLAARHPSAGDDPDERLQTVLLLALERIDDLAGQDVAWPAVSIAGNVRDRLRRRARHPAQVPLEEALHVPAGPERTTADRLAGAVVDGLRRGSLRRDDAALVYTTRVAGHPPATVAAACGLDPGLARTRLHRAERRLAEASLSVC